jgi:apolipoprotein N-acyltransferase
MDGRRARPLYTSYLQMTRQAIFQGAQFVAWPESATPFLFEEDMPAADELRRIAAQSKVPVLVGTDQVERTRPAKYYNSALMIDAEGRTAAAYKKMHLVPFGEYVPARQLFFFMSRLVAAVSDFSPGLVPTLLPVRDHLVSTSICYEVVYPDLVRRFVNDGAELLTTITNDAWFGPTSAPYQHFAQASLRAVENGRFLVRAANTGISGIVDPYGRVVQASAIYAPAIVVGDVRFLRSRTIYSRIGDSVAYASIAATLVLLVLIRRRVQ